MRLRRGCGCPLLILLVVDIILLVGALINLIQGPSGTSIQATRWGSGLMTALMAANAIVCLVLALGALRSQSIGGGAPQGGDEGVDYVDDSTASDADKRDGDD